MFDSYEFKGFDPLSSLPFVIFWNLGELVQSGHYDMTTLEAREPNELPVVPETGVPITGEEVGSIE